MVGWLAHSFVHSLLGYFCVAVVAVVVGGGGGGSSFSSEFDVMTVLNPQAGGC